MIRLFFSVKPEYRDHGVWVMNDATALVLRTMKDKNGNYLWNQANDTILGKPVKISNAMPDIGSVSKSIAFGDFSYYWIMDLSPSAFASCGSCMPRTSRPASTPRNTSTASFSAVRPSRRCRSKRKC